MGEKLAYNYKVIEILIDEYEKKNSSELERLSNKDDVVAQSILAIRCINMKNYDKAIVLLNKASSKGYAGAQNTLAVCYEFGIGVAKDTKKAIEWYSKAASQNNAVAMKNLGKLYCEMKDEKNALIWLNKAVELGNEEAKDILAKMSTNEEC